MVSHDVELSGTEPTLAAHFFDTMAPLLDRALEENRRERWPVVVLHLDFKTNEPDHHAAVWALLQEHQRWLTTAPRVADERAVQPLTTGPLLVLTEAGDGQAATFHDAVPVGEPLLLFGTVPPAPAPADLTAAERQAAAVTADPAGLIPQAAGNYRRWTNHSWAVVEEGGPPKAGRWTAQDRRRLEALVDRAHAHGLWIRFYTLNGHSANDEGWGEGYNFGSLERGEAALAGGHRCRRRVHRHRSVRRPRRRLASGVRSRSPSALKVRTARSWRDSATISQSKRRRNLVRAADFPRG